MTFKALQKRIFYLLNRFIANRTVFLWRYRSDLLFSLKLRTKFVVKLRQDQLELATPNLDNSWRVHATQYQTGSLINFKRLFHTHLNNQHFDHFFDIGCGLGKFVFYAEKAKIAKHCFGIENDPALHLRSLETKEKVSSNSFFIKADACTYLLEVPINSRNLIYMFNPFDQDVLRVFLTANLFKLQETIFFYENDVHIEVFLAVGFRVVVKEANCSILQLKI